LPKIATVQGLFFEKRSQPHAGHFFRDLPGRNDGDFMSKGAEDTLSNDKPENTKNLDVGMTGGAVGGFGEKGEGMSGGIYGTGTGGAGPKSESTKKRESEHERLQELLVNADGGFERKAEIDKLSAASPSDWDADSGLPVGFHRPAAEPPEGNDGLEAGGTRFLDSDADGPLQSAPTGTRHGLTETGGMTMKATSSPQMGKHASVSRFMGTSHGIQKTAAGFTDKDIYSPDVKEYAGNTGQKFVGSLKELGRRGTRSADEAIQDVASSPGKSGIAALVGGALGYKLLRGMGRRGVRLVRGKRQPPPGLLQQAGGALSSLIGGGKRR